jgi:ABC-type transport system involved in cytochrome bd biosynthesis fused ATPase/permease subunit
VLAGSLAVLAGVGLMATSAWLLSRAAVHPPVLDLMVAIAAVRAFGTARGVLRYVERLVAHDAAFRLLRGLRVVVWQRLERLCPAGLPAYRSGDLLARLVADVEALQDLFLRVLVPYGAAVVAGAGSVALLWWLLPSAGLVLLLAMLVTAVAGPWLSARAAGRAQRRTAALRGGLAAGAVELLQAAPDLVANGAAASRLAALRDLDRRLTRAAASRAGAAGLGAALVALPVAAFEAVVLLPQAGQQLAAVRASAARVADVLDQPDPVPDPEEPVALPEPPHVVRVEQLRARWPGSPRPALDGVDLELRPGRRIAVVGPSGSGKTTLLGVLARFLDPEAGRVRLGDVDYRDLTGDDVRRVVTCCGQDAHVFDSTVEQNLRIGRPGATAEELRTALAVVHLLEWVDALPDGLATRVGEHGCRISGGQRQRLAVARALLADPPVLLLDEPVEHLDPATVDALTAELLAVTEGRTTLVVTHRLAGLEALDEVLVLDAGRIVQRGTSAELLAVEGPYRRTWQRERAEVSGP